MCQISICEGDIDTYRYHFQTKFLQKSSDLSFSDIEEKILKISMHNFE